MHRIEVLDLPLNGSSASPEIAHDDDPRRVSPTVTDSASIMR